MLPRDTSVIGGRVLVGVDGSRESRDAAVLGRRLAEAAGGALHLVSAAWEPSIEVAAIRSHLRMDRVRDALLDVARSKVLASLGEDFAADELEQILTARIGRPEWVMAEAGRELNADLFVLGGRRHRTSSWIRRGTAHYLLRVCDQPVLLTGPNGARVERVVAAVDLSFATEPTIGVGLRLSSLLGVPLEVLHVVSRPVLPAGVELSVDIDTVMRRGAEEAERILSRLAPAAEHTVRSGEVMASICRFLDDAPSTLLVLGSHGRGWIERHILGSTAEALMAALPSSLAIARFRPDTSP